MPGSLFLGKEEMKSMKKWWKINLMKIRKRCELKRVEKFVENERKNEGSLLNNQKKKEKE